MWGVGEGCGYRKFHPDWRDKLSSLRDNRPLEAAAVDLDRKALTVRQRAGSADCSSDCLGRVRLAKPRWHFSAAACCPEAVGAGEAQATRRWRWRTVDTRTKARSED
jgi:hypothetical protein